MGRATSRPVVARERLFSTLDGLASAALTLVSAPVGFGKTTLVRSWCAARPDVAVVWVSIGPADDDPVHLWTRVAAAVERRWPGRGRAVLDRLRWRSVRSPATAVDELMEVLAERTGPTAVVLDDLHAVRSQACLRTVEHAVEGLPPAARIIATASAEPALRLARLRGHGLVGDVRARDLAFTRAEAHELLVEQHGLELEDREVETLHERTEGWPAGLALAALALGVDQSPSGARDLAAADRRVAAYLTSEVLEPLDAGLRAFLARTAALGRFSAAMCDAVLERGDSAAMLARIAKDNLFLVELDPRGEWFRYPGFFGDLLRRELARGDPSAVVALHRRASSWCEREGLLSDAVDHAAAAGDRLGAAKLLAGHFRAVLPAAGDPALRDRLDGLAPELLLAHPELAVASALEALLRPRPGMERRRLVRIAERAKDRRPARWTPSMDAALSLVKAEGVDADVGSAVRHGRRVVRLSDRARPEIAVSALSALAYSLYLAGDLEQARTLAQEAVDRADAPGGPRGLVIGLAVLALVDALAGRVREAEAGARRAVALAEAHGLAAAPGAGVAHVALAAALAARRRLREAEGEATRGERLRRDPEPSAAHAHAVLVLAGIRVGRGEVGRAERDVALARDEIADLDDPGRLPVLLAGVEGSLESARAMVRAERPGEEPSEAELAVLRLLATDLSLRQIGARLFRSRNTVKTQVREIYRKLGVSSRDQAVAWARALGLIGEDAPPAS